MSTIRIMLIDDHTLVRAGLRLLINGQEDMTVVSESDQIDSVLEAAARDQPDVVLLDLTLSGGPSLSIIGKLTQDTSARILVLTMHDDQAYVRAALSEGATGYVVKTVPEEVLLDAIRAVSKGRLFVDLDDSARTAELFPLFAHPPHGVKGASLSKLTSREIEVLRLLGHGHTNLEIAIQLELSPKTVATYRARIVEKVGLRSTADFVKFALDTGLIAPGRPQHL